MTELREKAESVWKKGLCRGRCRTVRTPQSFCSFFSPPPLMASSSWSSSLSSTSIQPPVLLLLWFPWLPMFKTMNKENEQRNRNSHYEWHVPPSHLCLAFLHWHVDTSVKQFKLSENKSVLTQRTRPDPENFTLTSGGLKVQNFLNFGGNVFKMVRKTSAISKKRDWIFQKNTYTHETEGWNTSINKIRWCKTINNNSSQLRGK